MRKAWIVAVLLLCLPGMSEAQSCDGCGIGYRPSSLSSSGGSLTGPLLLPNGTAAAPSLGFTNGTNTGIFFDATPALNFVVAGVTRFTTYSGETQLKTGSVGIYNNAGANPTFLHSEAANTLALRNGTAAQAFNIYNTYTDASNYERAKSYWNSNIFTLTTEAAGTGSLREIYISPGSGILYLSNTVETPLTDTGNFGRSIKLWQGAYFSRSIQGSKSKALTDAAAAAAIWSCAVPTSDSIGGELIWTTESTDATDYRATQGSIRFAGVNKAGTTTCTVGVIGTDLTASSNGNTLACTWTNVASSTNCVLSATCTDNTAGSQTMAVNSRLDMPIPQTCAPQ